MLTQNNSFNDGKAESFVISNYLPLLDQSSERGKYICPVCDGHKLSIHKSGLKYSCYDGCTGTKIAYKLRELNGEFNKRANFKDSIQVYKVDNPSKVDKSNKASSCNDKLTTIPDILAFLQDSYESRIAYNVRSKMVEIDDYPISFDCVAAMFGDKHKTDISGVKLRECLLYLGLKHQYDPVKIYLDRASKYTEPFKLEGLASILFNCEGELYEAYFRKWLIGCVARVYEPGCKLDEALILQHKVQGSNKSTFFQTLCHHPDYFTDSMTSKLDKDDLMLLGGKWIIEWSELDNFTAKAYHGHIKAFLSRQCDSYRPPYGKDVQSIPRRSVIVGSTNENDFLNDPTGNRRFWIIPVRHYIPIEAVDELRDSIWSAAVSAYRGGESWKLPKELWGAQAEDCKQYEQIDPWTDYLSDYLETQEGLHVTTKELLIKLEAQGVKVSFTRADNMRLADILKSLDWEQTRKRLEMGKNPVRVWTKTER